MNIFTVLFLILLVLKLLGVIAVSWWVVCAPLLVALTFFIILFVFFWRD